MSDQSPELQDLLKQYAVACNAIGRPDLILELRANQARKADLESQIINLFTQSISDRDYEWWQALALNDAVAPTPEAVKKWVMDCEALAKSEGAQVERAATQDWLNERLTMLQETRRDSTYREGMVDECSHIIRDIDSLPLMGIRERGNQADEKVGE